MFQKFKNIVSNILSPVLNFNSEKSLGDTSSDKVSQLLLSIKYRELLYNKMPLPEIADIGFRVFSQNDEDGILLYIFSLIGTVNKKVVEICAADGIQCNSANLIINHGWTGLLFDGDEEAVKRGIAFYTIHSDINNCA